MGNTPTKTPRVRVDGDTSKAKPNVSKLLQVTLPWLESVQIIWVPIALEGPDRELMMKVSESRDEHHYKVFMDVVNDYIKKNRESLEKEVDTLIDKSLDGMSVEEMERKVQLAQKQAEIAMSRLSRLKSLQTPPTPPTPPTPEVKPTTPKK